MPTTSNFGWTTPADTDYVKDGALAIRTLANGIDTSLIDLKGGTTGQILSKNSNTDLDYAWINNDQGDITAVTAGTGITGGGTTGSVTITNDMATTITAAGDIVVGTGNATYDNLPIGTTGQVLTADTSVSPYKVKWAPASPSFVGCSLSRTSSAVSIANSTATAIDWTSERFDTDGFHDNSVNPSRITIPSGKGGKYLFIADGQWDVNATGRRTSGFAINGGSLGSDGYNEPTASGTAYPSFNTSVILDLAAGDYVQWKVTQASGGNLNGYFYLFMCVYLGA